MVAGVVTSLLAAVWIALADDASSVSPTLARNLAAVGSFLAMIAVSVAMAFYVAGLQRYIERWRPCYSLQSFQR